jgi:hypothetical protein
VSFASQRRSEIWAPLSEIWPDFAKSAVLPKSGIWVFLFEYNGLCVSVQISEGCARNLVHNLDFVSKFNDLCQISDFGKSTPKGVGGLPASGGGGPPPTPGHSSRAEVLARETSDDGGRYRQASTAVVFHPSSQPEKETTHG